MIEDMYNKESTMSKTEMDSLIESLSGDKVFRDTVKNMDTSYNEKEVEGAWDDVLQTNHEKIHDAHLVDKPEFVKRQEREKSVKLKGELFNELPTPIRDEIIIEVIKEEKKIGKVLLSTDTLKDNHQEGYITKLGNKEYDFKLGDKIIFKPKSEKYRINHNNKLYFIISKEDVLAIYG